MAEGRMGRPPKAAGEHHVVVRITLPPELAARLKADPDGPSRAVARMLRAAGDAAS